MRINFIGNSEEREEILATIEEVSKYLGVELYIIDCQNKIASLHENYININGVMNIGKVRQFVSNMNFGSIIIIYNASRVNKDIIDIVESIESLNTLVYITKGTVKADCDKTIELLGSHVAKIDNNELILPIYTDAFWKDLLCV